MREEQESAAGRLRPGQLRVLLGAIALFGAIYGLEFAVVSPDAEVALLYALPTALLALEFGARGGLIGAAASIVLFGTWVEAKDIDVGALGYLTRGVAFFLVGGVLGRYAGGLRQSHAELQHLVQHDSLTGLFNRRRFEEELSRHLAYARRYGSQGAVVVFDIDNFKQINDTLGHRAGDEALTAVARVLRARLRQTDITARLGGDEFALVLPETGPNGARTVAEKIVEGVRGCGVPVQGEELRMTASVGASLFEEVDERTAEDVLGAADHAMYEAKRAGGDRFVIRGLADEPADRPLGEEVRGAVEERPSG